MKKYLVLILLLVSFLAFEQKEITWTAIGDSITYLNEHPDETGNRVSKGYMTLVSQKLPHVKYINQGHNGWTAGGIADKIENLGIGSSDVYTVFLGTNDWWAGRPLGQIEDYQNNAGNQTFFGSYRIIINKLRALNPQATIVLITPLQRSDFVYIANFKNNAYGSYRAKKEQQLEQFANAINQIAKTEGFALIDLYHKSGIKLKNMVKFKRLKDPLTGAYKNYTYPDYIDIPFDPTTDQYPYPVEATNMTYDGLHPSDKGNKAIAKMLTKQFKRFK
jgi:lysophospholipase L1-like esterase